jgi:hypothetical protein
VRTILTQEGEKNPVLFSEIFFEILNFTALIFEYKRPATSLAHRETFHENCFQGPVTHGKPAKMIS